MGGPIGDRTVLTGQLKYGGVMYTPELLGWENKVAANMKNMAALTPGIENVNRTWVNNLHRQYIVLLTRGYKPPQYVTPAGDTAAQKMLVALRDVSGYSAPIIRAFLVSLYTLRQSASIPAAKYDPFTVRAQETIRQDIDPGFWDKARGTVKTVAGIGAFGTIAALGIAAYFLTRK